MIRSITNMRKEQVTVLGSKRYRKRSMKAGSVEIDFKGIQDREDAIIVVYDAEWAMAHLLVAGEIKQADLQRIEKELDKKMPMIMELAFHCEACDADLLIAPRHVIEMAGVDVPGRKSLD